MNWYSKGRLWAKVSKKLANSEKNSKKSGHSAKIRYCRTPIPPNQEKTALVADVFCEKIQSNIRGRFFKRVWPVVLFSQLKAYYMVFVRVHVWYVWLCVSFSVCCNFYDLFFLFFFVCLFLKKPPTNTVIGCSSPPELEHFHNCNTFYWNRILILISLRATKT